MSIFLINIWYCRPIDKSVDMYLNRYYEAMDLVLGDHPATEPSTIMDTSMTFGDCTSEHKPLLNIILYLSVFPI